ncbi:phage holin family protein [Demetria terragena]|uniref:phage holin family protein n=1 Tax=Demetria terragena TaxID=63959 RepID=UPI000366AC12|nr:phage holin family protein [Demetria terragena]
MNVFIRIAINAVALWVAAAVVPGITLVQDSAETSSKILTIALVAAIFGIINVVVRPIAMFLSLPALILTLGLFTLVVNAAMLELTSWISGKLDLSFHVDEFFWSAILGGLIISLVSWALNIVAPDDRDRRVSGRQGPSGSARSRENYDYR